VNGSETEPAALDDSDAKKGAKASNQKTAPEQQSTIYNGDGEK